MTLTWFLIPIFVFVLLKHGMDTKAKQDAEKLRVLEEALRSGGLDQQSKEDLMVSLTGRPRTPPPRPVKSPQHVGFFLRFLAFIGWLGFCTGMAFVIIVTNFSGFDFLCLPATLLPCIGFGLVTFPFVLRELQSTSRRSETREQHS